MKAKWKKFRSGGQKLQRGETLLALVEKSSPTRFLWWAWRDNLHDHAAAGFETSLDAAKRAATNAVNDNGQTT